MSVPRQRLAVDAPLRPGAEILLEGNPAHYLSRVLRLTVGDAVALFNRADGEWRAQLSAITRKNVTLRVEESLRPAEKSIGLTVCFAPIKGGRLETIVEKATELGADVLQPVLTRRCVVDKVNPERLESIAREAAEQCERTGWPEICDAVKLETLLGSWPGDVPLIYGDETGSGIPITELLGISREATADPRLEAKRRRAPSNKKWAILAGPEGGFAPEELAALRHCKPAIGVGLGPRILRADTAIITLGALTLAAWGDWSQPPRFQGEA